MSEINKHRSIVTRSLRFLLYLPVPWVFVLAYLMGASLEILFPLGERSSMVLFISKIAGRILFLLGAILAGWGLVLFRKARTTTIPGKSSKKLVILGPYRFSRNPMYLGLTIAYIGEAGLLAQAWPLLILPFVIAYLNWVVIPVEEARLVKDFGNEYEQYCARVRRWL